MVFTATVNWKEEIDNVISMLNEGKSFREIGDVYNVTRQRVKQVCLKHGIIFSGSPGRRKQRELRRYKKFGDENQELYREKRDKYNRKKYNSTRSGIPFDLDFGDVIWNDVCPILNIPIDYYAEWSSENYPQFDKIIPVLGCVKGNVQIVSRRGNRIKNDGTLEEHIKVVEYMKKYAT